MQKRRENRTPSFIYSKTAIHLLLEYGFLLPETWRLAKEIKRINEYRSRYTDDVRGKLSLTPYIKEFYFGLSIKIDSIVVPYFVRRELFKEFEKFVYGLFGEKSSDGFNTLYISETINSRTASSGMIIGILYNTLEKMDISTEMKARRKMPDSIRKIEISVTPISEDVVCVSYRCYISRSQDTKLEDIYKLRNSDKFTVTKLATMGSYSSITGAPSELVKRNIIEKYLDSVQADLQLSRLVNLKIYITPDTYSSGRRRIVILRSKNYRKEIFNNGNNYETSVLLRILGIGVFKYRIDQQTYFQFANINRTKEDVSYAILSANSIGRNSLDSFVYAYNKIAFSQMYLESVRSKVHKIEDYIYKKRKYSLLKAENIEIFRSVYELKSFVQYNLAWSRYLTDSVKKINEGYTKISGERKNIDAKKYIEDIDKEAKNISRRMESVVETMKEIRDYKNVDFSFKMQIGIAVISILAAIFAATGIAVSVYIYFH